MTTTIAVPPGATSVALAFTVPAAPPVQGYSLTAPAQDANGWTARPVQQGTDRIIYCSSSTGSDGNSGTQANPFATLPKLLSMLRDGFGDWGLLKCGDVFTVPYNADGSPALGWWQISGASRTDPILIGQYGTGAYPLIKCGANQYLIRCMNTAHARAHVWWVGVNFTSDVNDPANSPTAVVQSNALYLLDQASDWHFEDCGFQWFGTPLSVYMNGASNLTDLRFRRCRVLNSYSLGMFAGGVTNLLIDGMTFDHNGWNSDAPGMASITDAQPTGFKHAIYLDPASNVSVVGNVISNSSNMGLLFKGENTPPVTLPATGPAGPGCKPSTNNLIAGNLFFQNANDITLGIDQDTIPAPGAYLIQGATIRGNLFTSTGRTVGGADQSCGVAIESGQNVAVTDNYFVNKPDTGASFCVSLQARPGVPQTGVTITGNLAAAWQTSGAPAWLYGATPLANCTVDGNPTSANPWPFNLDPTLIARARGNSKAQWDATATAPAALAAMGCR